MRRTRCRDSRLRSWFFVMLVGAIARPTGAAQTVAAPPETLTIRKVDCRAPWPAEGRLTLTERELVFEVGKKDRLAIPFERIRSVQSYLGEKHDQPIVDPSGIGMFWGFRKHKKAGFVFDYTNERGGSMGLVLQTEPKDGQALHDWLARFGVPMGTLNPKPAATPSP